MESFIEQLNTEEKRREILEKAVELLENTGFITEEEKRCMLYIIWRGEV